MKIRRILVAVDASSHSLAAVRASVELAAALEAELEGLFVEDQDLHHLTRLPFAREVDSSSGESRRLRPEQVERHLEREAELVRRAMEREARHRRVRWSFRVSRGRVTARIREAASDVDLIIVGVRSRTPTSGPGSTARALLSSGSRVMVLRRGARLDRRAVRVVFDGSEAAGEALELGRQVARKRRSELVVFLLGDGDPAEVEAELRRALVGGTFPARIVRLAARDPGAMAAVLRGRTPGLVILPRGALGEDERRRDRFLAAMDGPVLLVG